MTSEQKLKFKINTSENLDQYIQDYLIDGAKVTFHSRNEGDRPKAQIDFLKTAQKVVVSKGCFDVLGIDGLLVMKSIVVYDRVKSRDIYDLMVLTRDHGYTLDAIFAAIDAYQPIRHKDPEHFKSVVTGVIPLDKSDEGFASIHLNVKMDDVYKYFKKLINDYISVEELRACTTCNACVQECPVSISPVDIILQLRRYLVMEESSAPQEWNMMFSNIENNFAPWKFSPEDRDAWRDA